MNVDTIAVASLMNQSVYPVYKKIVQRSTIKPLELMLMSTAPYATLKG